MKIFDDQADRPFLYYAEMETDLIFNRGIDLPGLAAFPLLETEEGRRDSYDGGGCGTDICHMREIERKMTVG